ncbi:MAG: MBL fold metallo-hydrolase [Eubacteriales bacterium]|nr:MBL fold metallo-hydrolase [Eubacteriales bacterium]
MKLCSISSGSSGNCIFAGSEHTALLIDAGLSGKKMEQGLQSLGYKAEDLNGILVTHEHSDHIKGLGVMARRYGVPIYTTRGTWEAVKKDGKAGKIPEELFHEIRPDVHTLIGDMTIEPFRISHDAAEPVGYRMSHEGSSAAVATDMGTYDAYTLEHLQKLDAILLEANHDIRMLQCGRYPYYLKMRILGDHGHLSNEASGQLLSSILHDDLKHIFLGHLSAENNYPALAYETVCSEVTLSDTPYKSDDFPIVVARRDAVGEMIEF